MSIKKLKTAILILSGIVLILKFFDFNFLDSLSYVLIVVPFWLFGGLYSSRDLEKYVGSGTVSHLFHFMCLITIFLIVFFKNSWIDNCNLLIKYTFPGWGMALLLMSIVLVMSSGSQSMQATKPITFLYFFIVLLAIYNVSPFSSLKWFWLFAPFIFFYSFLLGNNAIFECGPIFRLPLICHTVSSILFLSIVYVFNADQVNEKILWISVGTSITFSIYCKTSLKNIRMLREKMQQRNQILLYQNKELHNDYYADKKIKETNSLLNESLDSNRFRKKLSKNDAFVPSFEGFSLPSKFNLKLLVYSILTCIIIFSTLGYVFAFISEYLLFKASFTFKTYLENLLNGLFPKFLYNLIISPVNFIFFILWNIFLRVTVSFCAKPVFWLYKKMNCFNSLTVRINIIFSFLSFIVAFFGQLARVRGIQFRDLSAYVSGDLIGVLALAYCVLWIYASIAIALGITKVRKYAY